MKDIIKVTDILLPNDDIEYMKWAVLACDQYTSEPEYWDKVAELAKDNKSAFHIVFPEVYLGQNDDERIKNINDTMYEYIRTNTFKTIKDSFILVDRTVDDKHRLGLVLAVDLEEYDFSNDSKACIRATEGTVLERIPPRVKIRQNAPLELPHIMLLMDDRDCTIIEELYKNRENLEELYNFDLGLYNGHIAGYRVSNTKEVKDKIYHLLDEDVQIAKYGVNANILFAVGDGNHSLATAKTHWDSIKDGLSMEEKQNHPARYALVEINNLYDSSIEFEPIHRVLFNMDYDKVKLIKFVFSRNKGSKIDYYYMDKKGKINVPKLAPLCIQKLQTYIDRIVKNEGVKVDYVHGEQNAIEVAKKNNGMALIMPTIAKQDLFKYIIDNGVLPRKSFSIGEAYSKRYYLEAKYIKPIKEIK